MRSRPFSIKPSLALLLLSFIVLPALPAHPQGAYNIQPASQTPEPPPQFQQTCSLCHGGDARGTDRAPNLVDSPDLRSISDADLANIILKGKGRMPAFPLPAPEVEALTRYLRAINTTAAPAVSGDASAGERIFFGEGQCATCHIARGRGSSSGPDLSAVAKRLSPADLKQSLLNPSAAISPGYTTATVTLNDGRQLSGFLRAQGSHDIVLQSHDDRLHLLLDTEYKTLTPETQSAMPAFKGTEEQQRNLLAYLSTLDGIKPGPITQPVAPPTPAEITQVIHPRSGDWPSYNGTLDGNRDSSLDQINRTNVATLQPQWLFPIPFNGLETTPLVVDGVMYVTANNQIYAISGKTGREIWHYERPKSPSSLISGDAALGVNRGAAFLGDRIFYLTDDAHLIALDCFTGALLWDVFTPEGSGLFGATSAPLVVGNLVITGVSGGDQGIRGFVAAYDASTGKQAWRLWTIPTPTDTGPIADTWKGTALALGGGATWTTGSADPDAGIIYWPVGNPHPDTDGDQRLGSNLYTNSDLAIDAKTGKLRWYFQYTPHDLHDWDANQPIVLADTPWRGQPRKLLLHANRNGFLYILDRTTGQPLSATRMVDTLNWASGINPKTFQPDLLPANETNTTGVVTCPAVRGATNWYSTAFNPATHLYYVMTVEDCTIYRKADDGGYRRYLDPAHPAKKILRAFNIDTGKPAWQIDTPGPVQSNYAGVLTTAGGLVFFGESSGGFAAVDAATGKYLWHFETNHAMKASPMTYAIDGRQYVAIASGGNIFSFALPNESGPHH